LQERINKVNEMICNIPKVNTKKYY